MKKYKYLLIIVCFGLLFWSYMIKKQRNQIKEAKSLPFYNVKVESVADGTYNSKCATSFYTVELDVTVAEKKLTKIDVITNKGKGDDKVTAIADSMIAQNKSVVSIIDGAELASLAFISCVDSALKKGTDESKLSE